MVRAEWRQSLPETRGQIAAFAFIANNIFAVDTVSLGGLVQTRTQTVAGQVNEDEMRYNQQNTRIYEIGILQRCQDLLSAPAA